MAEKKQKRPDEGEAAIRAMISDADEAPALPGQQLVNYPLAGEIFNGIESSAALDPDNLDEWGLPHQCPVIPLGYDGELYFFLDTGGQVQIVARKDFSKNTLGQLFMGHEQYLHWAAPRYKDGAAIQGSFHADRWYEILRGACFRKGPWNFMDRVRGRGAWTLENGDLVLHSGTQLLINGSPATVGEIEGIVYTTRPPIPRPWPEPVDKMEGPAVRLLPLLKTWQWDRPALDPILFIGWLAGAQVGGALPWRASIVASGDRGIGKSTLVKVARGVLGGALIHSTDATAAGIYQSMKSDSLAVLLDEFEAKEDNRKNKAMIDFVRQGADNNLVLRGGDNHKGVQFYCRSPFMMAGINIPAMTRADRSRMAFLRLYPLPKGAAEPVIDETELGLMGRQMMRRTMDNWHRLDERYQLYRHALAAGGHDSRGQDTYGILLAMADLVIGEDAKVLDLPMGTTDDLSPWAELCSVEAVGADDEVENWRECLDHLIMQQIDAWRTSSFKGLTIGEVLEGVLAPVDKENHIQPAEAQRYLKMAGVGLHLPTAKDPKIKLIIPHNSPGVRKLYQDSKWFGEAGVGIWTDALKQAPREIWTVVYARVSGSAGRALAIDLKDVLQMDAPAAPAERQYQEDSF